MSRMCRAISHFKLRDRDKLRFIQGWHKADMTADDTLPQITWADYFFALGYREFSNPLWSKGFSREQRLAYTAHQPITRKQLRVKQLQFFPTSSSVLRARIGRHIYYITEDIKLDNSMLYTLQHRTEADSGGYHVLGQYSIIESARYAAQQHLHEYLAQYTEEI